MLYVQPGSSLSLLQALLWGPWGGDPEHSGSAVLWKGASFLAVSACLVVQGSLGGSVQLVAISHGLFVF